MTHLNKIMLRVHNKVELNFLDKQYTVINSYQNLID